MVGASTADSLTTGEANVGVGHGALGAATTSSYNTAVGFGVGSSITTGYGNVFSGYIAGEDCTTGYYNIAIGYAADKDLLDGNHNIAIGPNALKTNYSGSNNVGVGSEALTAMTTGNSNVGVGFQAGGDISSASNCIAIGIQAGKTGSPGGSFGTTSNLLCLGDENITAANIQVDWTVASDKRDKTDVEPMDLGLEFINQLEPVTYRWDKRSKYSEDQSVSPDGTHKEEQLEGGFLAQDVEAIEEQYGHKLSDNTNLTFHLSSDEKMYGIKYGKFVPMLVKAVQELSAEVEALKKGE